MGIFFSEQVHISISNFEQQIVYYDLRLTQKMMDHHDFSFVWQYTSSPIIKPADQAAALRKYKGAEVIFTFKSLTGIRLMSKGIIQGLKSVDVNGCPVGLHVRGISHTILLDDMKKSRTFSDRNLKEIALNIFAEETAGEFYVRDAIEPNYKKIFDYKLQYNETSFEFLKRLSAQHGEWLYFDGMRIQFGQTKTSKVKLINGASLHNFSIETNLVSHKTSFAGYDYNNAAGIRDSSAISNTGSTDSFSSVVRDRQGNIALPDLRIGAYASQAKDTDAIKEMVRLQTAGRDANSVFYSGVSYLPIGVGQVFTIVNQTVEHELIAIEVVHHSEVHGNYTCEFKAIPADVVAPHYTNVEVFRRAESQPAKIKDNKDPEGMGRVQVEFFWASGSTVSDWMRMVQPYAGSGRGFYLNPEIGDEVRVDFEGGNIDCPYVSGAHYNGQAKPDFFDSQNSIKGWKLRFGQLFKFIEKVGIWLSDPSGNELYMNEETKSTTLTVPETATIRAKNIIFEATESITLKAGTNIIQEADQDINISATGDITEKGDNKTENIMNTYTRSSLESTQFAEQVSISSTEENMLLESTEKTVEINSTEKSNLF